MTRGRPRWGIFLGIAATVVILDQASKAWLVGQMDPGELPRQIIGDLLRIVHSQNDGALFGMFRDQALLFGIVSIGVIGLIGWYHGNAGRSTLLSVALGLLLGGAIGNMIDRFRVGYVVDWVDLGIGDWRFYTFNVADSAITGAILLLLLIAFLPARPDRSAEATAAAGEATAVAPEATGVAQTAGSAEPTQTAQAAPAPSAAQAAPAPAAAPTPPAADTPGTADA